MPLSLHLLFGVLSIKRTKSSFVSLLRCSIWGDLGLNLISRLSFGLRCVRYIGSLRALKFELRVRYSSFSVYMGLVLLFEALWNLR